MKDLEVKSASLEDKKPSLIKKVFNHPLTGYVIGFLGIVVTLYFGIFGVSRRKLMFSQYPIRTTVVKSGEISSLEVFYNNNKLSTDISAVQIALWNSGNKEIEKNDILEPITIYSEPGVRFLEARTKRVSREVIKLALGAERLQDGLLPISWAILEKNDGSVIQIIYSGKPDAKFRVKGIIKGQKGDLPFFSAYIGKTPFQQRKEEITHYIFSGVNTLIIMGFLFLVYPWSKKRYRFFGIILISGNLFIAIISLLYAFVYIPNSIILPPFGFF